MFGWFKKNASADRAHVKASDFFSGQAVAKDLLAPDTGLKRLADYLGLDRSTPGFKEDLSEKLFQIAQIFATAGDKSGLLRRLVSEKIPDHELRGEMILDYGSLSDFGQGLAMLGFCMKPFSAFYGSGREATIRNAVSGDGVEYRAIIFLMQGV